jgi:poly-gamma-glutamate synthesis protein (capsule biosynthesis protein)
MDSALTRRTFIHGLAGLLPAAALLAPRRPADAEADPATTPFSVIALGQAVGAFDLRVPPAPALDRLAALLREADACTLALMPAAPGAGRGAAVDPAALDALKALNIGLVALAGAGTSALGSGGIADLVAAARSHDLTIAGAGADLGNANAAGYRTLPGAKVALVAAASGDVPTGVAAGDGRPGINVIVRLPNGRLDPLDIERVAAQVHAAAENANVAVVYLQHEGAGREAGRDGAARLDWIQRVGRRAIEFGAGMVVGTGLPQIQGIELYRGRPIFYGLGNFALQAADDPPAEALQALAARCTWNGGTLAAIELIPLALALDPAPAAEGDAGAAPAAPARPALADEAAATAILARVAALSRPHDVTLEVAAARGRIAL